MRKSNIGKLILIILGVLVIALLFYWARTADTQDNVAPEVVSTNPGDGAKDVATNASIHVYFSEPMDPSTITTNTFIVADSFGATIPGEVTYANNAAAFVHFTHMDEMSTYNATVSGGVTDHAGNSLGSDYSWSFTTASD